MDPVAELAIKNPSDSANFAKWIGIDTETAPDVVEEAPEAEAVVDEVVDDAVPEIDGEEPADTKDEDAKDDDEDEEPKEVPKLAFEAKTGEDAVDPALLNEMVLTFKADGKTESLSLVDMVRRAQSEPAAQRQARAATEDARRFQTSAQEIQAELEQVRELAIRVLRDPEYYVEVSGQVAQYDTPDARAERAESALAEDRSRRSQEAEASEFQRVVQTFAQEQVAPALTAITASAPLVSEEEILGRFFADTAQWTVNGVIHPRHHDALAHYLRTDLAEFVKQRQGQRDSDVAKTRAEARKTQVERQKMKNQSAQAARPAGVAGATRDSSAAPKPRTAREAEQSALSVLLGDMA